jgi:hypothetical protein
MAVQVARNPPNDVVTCPKAPQHRMLKRRDAGKNILQVAHLPNPPSLQLPPLVFLHRDIRLQQPRHISHRRRGIQLCGSRVTFLRNCWSWNGGRYRCR